MFRVMIASVMLTVGWNHCERPPEDQQEPEVVIVVNTNSKTVAIINKTGFFDDMANSWMGGERIEGIRFTLICGGLTLDDREIPNLVLEPAESSVTTDSRLAAADPILKGCENRSVRIYRLSDGQEYRSAVLWYFSGGQHNVSTSSPDDQEPEPPPLRSLTGTISDRNGYDTRGSVTLRETSDGMLNLTITGLDDGGAPDVWLALCTPVRISTGALVVLYLLAPGASAR